MIDLGPKMVKSKKRSPDHTMRLTTFKAALILSLLGPVSAVGLTISSDAVAQDDEALIDARAKFQRAIELEQGKNWSQALKLFRQVGQVKMTAQVRYHIATCEEQLGQLVVALGGYELALAQAEGMPPEFIADVQSSVDDLKSRIPKLVIERGAGAEAASIELDGVALGFNAIGVETPINPGPHAVTATAPGYEPYRETVSVAEGSVKVLSIVMEEIGAKEPEVATPPPQESGEPEKRFGVLPYVIGGAGAVVTITGVTFLVVAGSKKSKAKGICGGDLEKCDPNSDTERAIDLVNSTQTYEALGIVSIGLGVAGLATGAVLYYLDNKSKFSSGSQQSRESTQNATLRFAPVAPQSDVGFSVLGSF